MQITQAVILPVREKKSDKSPDFRVTAKIGDEWKEVAACWKKSSEKGPYLSLKFGDHVTVEVGEQKPWSPKLKADPSEAKAANDDFASLTTLKTSDVVNPADVPF
jgi:hypothetical protein